jgi:hypothetical protein
MSKSIANLLIISVLASSVVSMAFAGSDDKTGSKPIASIEQMAKSINHGDDDCGSRKP